MVINEIFLNRRMQWGYRGDPHFWDYLRKNLSNEDISISEEELETKIFAMFEKVTGKVLEEDERYYVKEFDDREGMSAGYLCGSWWLENGIPQLKSNLRYLKEDPDILLEIYDIKNNLQRYFVAKEIDNMIIGGFCKQRGCAGCFKYRDGWYYYYVKDNNLPLFNGPYDINNIPVALAKHFEKRFKKIEIEFTDAHMEKVYAGLYFESFEAINEYLDNIKDEDK